MGSDTPPANDHDLIIRMDEKLDAFISEVRNSLKEFTTQTNDHELRIRDIEKQNNEQQGALNGVRWVFGVLFALVGIIEPLILWYVTRS